MLFKINTNLIIDKRHEVCALTGCLITRLTTCTTRVIILYCEEALAYLAKHVVNEFIEREGTVAGGAATQEIRKGSLSSWSMMHSSG